MRPSSTRGPFRYPYGERDLNSNVLLEYRLQQGDMQAGFAEADVVVESTYRTHAQEHAYLQPEAGLAWVRPDGRIEVICGGQWMHEERGADRPCAGPAGRPGRGALSGHWRRVWRARGYFGADRAGAGGVEDGPAGQDRVEP